MTSAGAVRHVVYLHGFASSPGSSKAQRFKRELEARGVGYSCPDFNEPAFETLTVTRMLHQTMAAIAAAPAGPVALIGSSLGAFVAVLTVARTGSGGVSVDSEREAAARRVDRIILLAPALDFGGNRVRPRDIGFDLYADAARYHALDVAFDQPALVFQGKHDDTVDSAMVQRWSRGRPNVDLHLFDDDHRLTASMDVIWPACAHFLGV